MHMHLFKENHIVHLPKNRHLDIQQQTVTLFALSTNNLLRLNDDSKVD